MKRQPTVQDVTWFLDLHRQGKLNLDPPYQRKSVWTLKDRRFFLDTVFRDFPCPPIFLHRELDDNGSATYHVVDGKQRLQSIIDFTNNVFSLDKEFGDSNLNGKLWKDVPTEYKRKLWDYILSIEYINNISDTTTVNEVFDRVNRNQKKLDRQELRHAKYNGWFINVAESETEEEIWKDFGISTTARARRMRDVQFVSELMLVILENAIRGFDQDTLDDKYAQYDDPDNGTIDFNKEDYSKRVHEVKQFLQALEKENQIVTKHAKSLNHFYTLWAFVVLYGAGVDVKVSAKKYDAFMEKVKQYSSNEATEDDKNVIKYASNSLGASTDLKQRTLRLEALKAALTS